MYLHLGADTVVRTSEILGIFDLETATIAKATKRFLAQAEKGGCVVNVTQELPKSFVVVGGQGRQLVYISQISTATLKKRMQK